MKKTNLVFTLIILSFLSLNSCKKDSADDDMDPMEVYNPTYFELTKPQGFPDINIPEDNPMTIEGVELGRMLFYDKILSGDNSQSCATCHAPEFSFTDNGKQFSEGIDGNLGNRNAPSVINTVWLPSLFWDGRAATVEDQALGPVPNPIEMNLPWPEAMQKLNAHPDYPDLFFKAFGTRNIDSMQVVKAIAQFERTMISSNSKWDRYLRNEASLTQAESQGFEIFFSEVGDCFHCHTTILFTDNLFHNNGMDANFDDLGLGKISGNDNDNGKFKTPTLRNIEFTAPFMHDGRFETIEEVIDFYSEGVVWSETIDPLMKKVDLGGLHLTDDQKENLIAFLKTLTDESYLENPDYADPFED